MADVEYDLAAARLQLAELELQQQALQDTRLALQLALQDNNSAVENQGPEDFCDASSLGGEEQQLQEQITSLAMFITRVEDQAVALCSVQQEEAQQAASVQLASALSAQEEWEATVLRPHDAALARAIAGCSDGQWQESGGLLQNPLDLSERPAATDDSGTPCLSWQLKTQSVCKHVPSAPFCYSSAGTVTVFECCAALQRHCLQTSHMPVVLARQQAFAAAAAATAAVVVAAPKFTPAVPQTVRGCQAAYSAASALTPLQLTACFQQPYLP